MLAGAGLDRAHQLRCDAEWQAERLADPGSRLLAVAGSSVPVAGEADAPRAGYVSPVSVAGLLDSDLPAVFLGLDGETAVFAADVSDAGPDALADALGEVRLVALREIGALVSQEEGGLLAYASGLVGWHRRQRFCGVCGSRAAMAEAGHLRVCTNPADGTRYFPRTDPVVIMLVTDGDRCLLGRQPVWPPGRYSALAGYVEPGESLEEAVVREVREEADIDAGEVTYRSSQPWPFPSSLMLGFTAAYLGGEARVADEELEDVRWVGRDELREKTAAGDLMLPPPVAIARRLIEEWLEEDRR